MSERVRVVLITGASSGIGKVCAMCLVSRGWRVFGTSRGEQPDADGVEMVRMDVDDEASVQRAVAEVHARGGRIDAVINNAGFALAGSVEDTTIDEAKAQFETNFFGVHRVCRAVLPIMRAQRRGTIVNISSLAGAFGLPFAGMYSASKFALEGLSETLRYEVRRFGIDVVLIQPGDFCTDISQRRRFAAGANSAAYGERFEHFRKKQEVDERTAPTPEAIAGLVERILNQRHPNFRHPIGQRHQTMVIPLRRWLPQRAFNWLAFYLLGE